MHKNILPFVLYCGDMSAKDSGNGQEVQTASPHTSFLASAPSPPQCLLPSGRRAHDALARSVIVLRNIPRDLRQKPDQSGPLPHCVSPLILLLLSHAPQKKRVEDQKSTDPTLHVPLFGGGCLCSLVFSHGVKVFRTLTPSYLSAHDLDP